jgi:hypothetical protein
MKIIDYDYNEDDRILYIEFSLKKDLDEYYRIIELDYSDIEYYSPTIIDDEDLSDIDNEFIIELLGGYFKENKYPEQLML